MLRAIIVDDEQPAREDLRERLSEEQDIEVIAECSNAIEAIPAIQRLQPDVIFLDIQMPRINGLELVSMLNPENMPHIVFVTAYDEYAIRAFEEHAFDYLLKPLDQQRLAKTLTRLRRGLNVNNNLHKITEPMLRHIPCSGHNRIFLLKIEEVEYLSSELSGVHVVGVIQSGYTQLSLKTLEEKTPFIRCHRQYMVNTEQLREIQLLDNGSAEVVTRTGKHIPVSRRYLKTLKEKLGIT
ncbi:two-component system response regulator BtsR [Yersinia ruckeri]|uniref:two-component system response regulator BtsR n=1 Tax=Yersinia ruckeri TaxID=29486 RepID=UPI001F3A1385|nr:two-component system response regulator BtsR [Yersinia ruckeri]MCW6540718.1 two-component system response regulator BtsR [Yersinia ruckeri]MCW6544929.1 two-component system response regulator BtsR [Yersinia ruckeri]MCW6572888.1 two-component system response regulator BtsR [Yersinia ruckeri]MCW6638682.1 two-component system response regulator BtsR [Yersinia ruckeri]UIN01497.1 two-component system response regulator BtsR [Yersinia ruckeri]